MLKRKVHLFIIIDMTTIVGGRKITELEQPVHNIKYGISHRNGRDFFFKSESIEDFKCCFRIIGYKHLKCELLIEKQYDEESNPNGTMSGMRLYTRNKCYTLYDHLGNTEAIKRDLVDKVNDVADDILLLDGKMNKFIMNHIPQLKVNSTELSEKCTELHSDIINLLNNIRENFVETSSLNIGASFNNSV